jgi:hypothetical protein
LQDILKQYGLKKKIIAFVKDEGSKLNIMTIVLKSIISCKAMGMEESFKATCFGCAFLRLVNMQMSMKESIKF